MKKYLVVNYESGRQQKYDVTDGTKAAEEGILDAFAEQETVDCTFLEDAHGRNLGYSSLEWSVKVVIE